MFGIISYGYNTVAALIARVVLHLLALVVQEILPFFLFSKAVDDKKEIEGVM
jgi:hypothetical protein